MIPIPVADPAVLLSDRQQEPATSTTHSDGKQKKPSTKAPKRRPPPIGKNLRVIKSKTSPSLEIYQFEWRAEVANVDQGSTSFVHETMKQQTGSQNHFNAVQPEIQQNTNWLGKQFQYPVQDWNVLDPQSQQSLSQSPQGSNHGASTICSAPKSVDQNQAARFAYSAEGDQLKQTAKRLGTHSNNGCIPALLGTASCPHNTRVRVRRCIRHKAHQDQMSSGMNVLLPPLDYCQPSYQSSGTSSASSFHASASAFMTPVSNEKYSHSPYGTTFDAETFQIPPAG
ncbi:hypothetical protein F5890DRAFT_1559311 [Lentinula detonsa]|uniref:Uncharacterized protein n=1 Tax=Lentinula detonsa TaxID=2804962 RepID=A0AA38PNS1_9AGAR|nr:hypothetical protein F5890DRAFT_1559311 [Lentinula detonsa]